MIRLKYLTFCLLGLSLSGCTQHVIKTNNEKQALDQQAVRGLNAMYQYPSYDYSGHFSVNVDASTAQSRKNHPRLLCLIRFAAENRSIFSRSTD